MLPIIDISARAGEANFFVSPFPNFLFNGDLKQAKQKYPMTNVWYEGKLDTELYNRFMLIGEK